MGKDLKGKELGPGVGQRKDGIYYGRYTDKRGARRTIYNKKLLDLRKKLAEAIAEDEAGLGIRERVRLDDWFRRWMSVYKDRSVRDGTKLIYERVYKTNISPYIGRRYINTLTKSDIQSTVDEAYDAGYSWEIQNKIKIMLKDMLSRAQEDRLIGINPVSGIKVRSERTDKRRVLTQEEERTFLEYAKGSVYENMFRVALNTGLRPGELYALTPADVNMDEGFIDVNKTLVYQKYPGDEKKTFHLEDPKTKSSIRRVPINSECREYLARQFELKEILAKKNPHAKTEFLFVSEKNTPINVVMYSDAIMSVIRRINATRAKEDEMAPFSGHTFRHTFATRCFESGVNAKVVQEYLGHATLQMTMDLYTHVTDQKLSDDIERIVPKNFGKIIDFERKRA